MSARRADPAEPETAKVYEVARKRETDLSRYDLTRGSRGKYVHKARRSFETIVVDKQVLEALGGPGMGLRPSRAQRRG